MKKGKERWQRGKKKIFALTHDTGGKTMRRSRKGNIDEKKI